ncbi:MAG TPA: FtsX-like permease family protein [Flavitalea sp.]|nr:FtsX-like permease family protein [Flavitalea sp.]
MFTHLFKLIWNKKKQNFLLMMEIFFSFIGLFAGFTFVLYPYNNYKIPNGFEDKNVWVVNLTRSSPEKFLNGTDKIENVDSLEIFRESVKKVLLSINGVEDVTYSSVNFPYSSNGFNAPIKYNGKEAWGNLNTVEDNYQKVLSMKMREGRWFSSDDKVSTVRPIVINQALKIKLFGDEDALGKIVETDVATEKMKIVGVVTDTKDESEYEVPASGLFRRMDTGDLRNDYSILMKVKPGADATFESAVHKTLSNTIRNANIEIEHLSDMKEARNKVMLVPFIIFLIIAGFLLINVALGIFGVLWYNIHRRKAEIGLRRAVGATGKAISWQLVTEAILLATLSLILGSFFAVQFPLLKSFDLPANNYIVAIIYSILSIYVLVILCALYPGRQAAGIYPATALHED